MGEVRISNAQQKIRDGMVTNNAIGGVQNTIRKERKDSVKKEEKPEKKDKKTGGLRGIRGFV